MKRFLLVLASFWVIASLTEIVEGCSCLPSDNPVCGDDGLTYPNPCILFCINFYRAQQGLPTIKIACNGTCESCKLPPCPCDKRSEPVCGEDGKTYGNPCMFDCENKRRKFYGLPILKLRCKARCSECPAGDVCNCPLIYKPICGSDNKTYINNCFLGCENKEREKQGLPKIYVRCNTTCELCKPTSCPCTLEVDPVCGEDGKTYGNPCMFDCENKRREFYGLPKLKLRCKRACKQCPEDCICTDEYVPVCGSDGKTYGNLCEFNCENKRRAELHLPPITIRCKHACKVCDEEEERCNCTEEYYPVCGSDGVSYNNPCDLDCGNFHRELLGLPPIIIVCYDVCDACYGDDCACTAEFKPVCGSNNQTYSNKCVLNCENRHRKPPVTVECTGKCPCSHNGCICPMVYDPVCGSDNKTYGNVCLLGCENKRRKAHGLPPISENCKGECPCCDECKCPTDYIPVCGSDGVTYRNLCLYVCENVRRKCRGLPSLKLRCNVPCDKCPIKDPCLCQDIYKPVCAADNKTYSNACELDCENRNRKKQGLPKLGIKCNGTCESCKPPPCSCDKRLDPVCGSDNKTYSNPCLFDCENKRREFYGLPKLKLRCKAACDKCPIINCSCTYEYIPVCGTDGKTYANRCQFDCENKRRAQHNLPPIGIRCKHACKFCDEEEERCTCTREYSPVCGSDGVSYNNPCDLDCGNFHRELQGLPPIEIICYDVCDLCDDFCLCTNKYKPVCASDGKTYKNRCELDCENIKRIKVGLPYLRIICRSECENCRK